MLTCPAYWQKPDCYLGMHFLVTRAPCLWDWIQMLSLPADSSRNVSSVRVKSYMPGAVVGQFGA